MYGTAEKAPASSGIFSYVFELSALTIHHIYHSQQKARQVEVPLLWK